MTTPAAKQPAGPAVARLKRQPPVDTFSQGTLVTAAAICAVAYAVIAGVAYSGFNTTTPGSEPFIVVVPVALAVQIMGLLIASQEISTGWPGRLGPCYTTAAASFALAAAYAMAGGFSSSGYRQLALLNGSIYAGMLAEAVTGVTGRLAGTEGAKASAKQD